MIKEPILSDKVNLKRLDLLPFPMYGSPKLDGFRAFNANGKLFSRKLKPIPNEHTNRLFGSLAQHGLDGELCVGPPSESDVCRKTNSGVRSRDGEPDVQLWVFDDWTLGDILFERRIREVEARVRELRSSDCGELRFVKHEPIADVAGLLVYEQRCLAAGYEGVMLRHRLGPYKEGRCGKETPWLFKMKRFETSEARIVEVHEKMHNDNPAEVNELGRTKRSGHKENKRPAGTLGGLTLELIEDLDVQSETGSVFTFPKGTRFRSPMGKTWGDSDKQKLWNARESLPGQVVSFEHFAYGVKDRPRFPKVIRIKGTRDMEIDG